MVMQGVVQKCWTETDVIQHLVSNIAFKKRMEMKFVCLIIIWAMYVFSILIVDHFSMNETTILSVDHFI